MEKIYCLELKTNPHIPSSGYVTTVFMTNDIREAFSVYDSFPELHYTPGKKLPALILKLQTYSLPWKNEYMLTSLRKK